MNNDLANRTLIFPTYNVPLSKAIEIVKYQLGDDSIPIQTKTISIDQVANMETHNSITKKDLINALQWLFRHYEF